jgi:hypothetical protein
MLDQGGLAGLNGYPFWAIDIAPSRTSLDAGNNKDVVVLILYALSGT